MSPARFLSLVLLLGPTATAAAQPTTVTFQLPAAFAAVERILVYRADGDLRVPVHAMEAAGTAVVPVASAPHLDVVVLFVGQDGSYLTDGPFRWPSTPASRSVAPVVRRTVTGRRPASIRTHEAPTWLEGGYQAAGAPWPRCYHGLNDWFCVGIPAASAGVVLLQSESPVMYGVVRPANENQGQPTVQVITAQWAGAVLLDGYGTGSRNDLRLRVVGPVASSHRRTDVRLFLEWVRDVRVELLADGCYLVAGNVDRDDLLLEVDGEAVATARVPIGAGELTVWQPLRVTLTPPLTVSGLVRGATGEAAAGAQLHLSELVERRDGDGRTVIVRRALRDSTADGSGRFTLPGLGDRRYELLAMHPALGRRVVTFQPQGRPLDVELEAGQQVRGRVVRRGRPLPNVWVDVPPDHQSYLEAADPLDVLSFAAVTDSDGRFLVTLPPRGAVELRLAHEGAVVRVPVAGQRSGRLELGDIEWPGSIAVRIVYAADERCGLAASGPLGRSGMTIVEAVILAPGLRRLMLPEPGRWVLALVCLGREVAVDPPILEVPADVPEWSAYVMTGRR